MSDGANTVSRKGKVALCCPSLFGPTEHHVRAVQESIPLIAAAGWESMQYIHELGNAYISQARSAMLQKALKDGADVIVFLDYDVSWRPQDLLTLIETEGDVVAGVYRFKTDERHEYMTAVYSNDEGEHYFREDGCVLVDRVCAGFLKITRNTVETFKTLYPNLVYHKPSGPKDDPKTVSEEYVDLFNHGAFNDQWWGEDYAFCRNWNAIGGEIWVIPDLVLTHHDKVKGYVGHFAQSLEREKAKRKSKDADSDGSPEARENACLLAE